jgi:hypothetical protein
LRIFGLALAGALVGSAGLPAYAGPPGSKMELAAPVRGIAQLDRGSISGRHPARDERGAVRQPGAQSPRPMGGMGSPALGAPNRYNGSWGPYVAWGGPYSAWGAPYVPYVWGSPVVPYRCYGDWGALWYPYAEWRGPTGGWGNP